MSGILTYITGYGGWLGTALSVYHVVTTGALALTPTNILMLTLPLTIPAGLVSSHILIQFGLGALFYLLTSMIDTRVLSSVIGSILGGVIAALCIELFKVVDKITLFAPEKNEDEDEEQEDECEEGDQEEGEEQDDGGEDQDDEGEEQDEDEDETSNVDEGVVDSGADADDEDGAIGAPAAPDTVGPTTTPVATDDVPVASVASVTDATLPSSPPDVADSLLDQRPGTPSCSSAVDGSDVLEGYYRVPPS